MSFWWNLPFKQVHLLLAHWWTIVENSSKKSSCLTLLGGETPPPHLLLLLLTQVQADDGEPKKFHPLNSNASEDKESLLDKEPKLAQFDGIKLLACSSLIAALLDSCMHHLLGVTLCFCTIFCYQVMPQWCWWGVQGLWFVSIQSACSFLYNRKT